MQHDMQHEPPADAALPVAGVDVSKQHLDLFVDGVGPGAAGRRLRVAKGRGISRDRALAHAGDTWRGLAPLYAWIDRNVGRAEVEPARR